MFFSFFSFPSPQSIAQLLNDIATYSTVNCDFVSFLLLFVYRFSLSLGLPDRVRNSPVCRSGGWTPTVGEVGSVVTGGSGCCPASPCCSPSGAKGCAAPTVSGTCCKWRRLRCSVAPRGVSMTKVWCLLQWPWRVFSRTSDGPISWGPDHLVLVMVGVWLHGAD